LHKSKILTVLIVLILVSLAGGFSYLRKKQAAHRDGDLGKLSEAAGGVANGNALPLQKNAKDKAVALKDIEQHGLGDSVNTNSNLNHATNTPNDNIQQARDQKEQGSIAEPKTALSPSEVVEAYNKEWLNFEKAVLSQTNFETRIQAMYLGLKSLQQRTRVMTDANLELKISSELLISVLKVIPENQSTKIKCADYLRKVFFEFDPNAFKSDIFEKSWTQNLPQEPSVKRAYLLMVKVCQ